MMSALLVSSAIAAGIAVFMAWLWWPTRYWAWFSFLLMLIFCGMFAFMSAGLSLVLLLDIDNAEEAEIFGLVGTTIWTSVIWGPLLLLVCGWFSWTEGRLFPRRSKNRSLTE